jgi:hypothetical protein
MLTITSFDLNSHLHEETHPNTIRPSAQLHKDSHSTALNHEHIAHLPLEYTIIDFYLTTSINVNRTSATSRRDKTKHLLSEAGNPKLRSKHHPQRSYHTENAASDPIYSNACDNARSRRHKICRFSLPLAVSLLVSFQTFPFNPYRPCLTLSFASISAPLAINSSAVTVCPFSHALINAVQLSYGKELGSDKVRNTQQTWQGGRQVYETVLMTLTVAFGSVK